MDILSRETFAEGGPETFALWVALAADEERWSSSTSSFCGSFGFKKVGRGFEENGEVKLGRKYPPFATDEEEAFRSKDAVHFRCREGKAGEVGPESEGDKDIVGVAKLVSVPYPCVSCEVPTG